MITSYIKLGLSLILFFIITPSFAQDNFTGYLEPQISVNHKISPLYAFNFSTSNRAYFYKDGATAVNMRQLDFAHFSELTIASNQSFSLGIQYRFRALFEEEKENELRITQQYNYKFKPKSIRYGHRVRTEQRISPSLTTFRFRYRFAADMPLKGEKLDIGEPYIIVSTESLLSVANTKKPSYDQRFSSQIGYKLSSNTKVQIGLEYRLEEYNTTLAQVLFLNSAFVLTL
ncbi:DUF2490 domain-containing protein [Cellulophaga sp. E16_2]|uniref:DUF2490 domain-containing protein n=1 Tax=Cellulophaga algicola (strain DSM 14237 / IC166 / ACAM 630) TaxID=688270 RepID=E6X564_CELAD|nr:MULTISPECIES: DUF2490 domain-containing protein [Cellulophaga]ADV48375.1 Protein of unknown function DUF2490 [Cellulophaga algicola DSM 14237]MBO0590796.1 DUF2490 domain-containing protein [Cellulophaga sp. E16_2]